MSEGDNSAETQEFYWLPKSPVSNIINVYMPVKVLYIINKEYK